MANQEFPPVQKQRFTLFHLLGLAALVGILAGLLAPTLSATDHLSKFDRAKLRVAVLQHGIEQFKEDNGYYPTESNGLSALVIRPIGATNWHQYLESGLIDPWGHAYRYEFPGKHSSNSFDISSAGPDGKFGTKDDIGNWDSDGK